MTSLLIPDSPLLVLPSLACATSLTEAIVLQQVHYLSLRATADGWVAKSINDWGMVFPFLSQRSIERTFASLRKAGLLMVEPVPGGGRRTRVRIDHDAVDSLAQTMSETPAANGEVNRQIGGTNPPNWRDQSAKLAGPIRQIGGDPLCIGAGEETTEETADAASQQRARRATDEDVSLVFTTWQSATGRTDAVLDDKRRRRISKALRSHGLADCLDAVKGWRHSAHHRGDNRDGVPKNDLGLLLADAESIERFCALERHRGDSTGLFPGGNVADRCPGPVPEDVAERWAPIAAELAERVPATTHDIWLQPLHPHADVDGTLFVGVPPELLAWVTDRFRAVLDDAAGETPVTLVECGGPAA